MASSSDLETSSFETFSPLERYRALYAETDEWAKSANITYDPYEDYSVRKEPGRTRVCIIRFPHEQPVEVEQIQSPDSLHELLTRDEAGADSAIVCRQMILVEDLDPRYVEVLGTSLGIPPLFFVLQSQMGDMAITDEDCKDYDPAQYWRIEVPQVHNVMTEQRSANALGLEPTFAKRLVTTFPEKEWHLPDHPVSYWALKDNESWTVVIAVDPAFKQAYEFQTRQMVELENEILPSTSRISMNALKLDNLGHAQQEAIGDRTFSHNSMFDRLVNMYRKYPVVATEDPTSATGLCSALICSMFRVATTGYVVNVGEVWFREWGAHELHATPDGRTHAAQSWVGENYVELMQSRYRIQCLKYSFQEAAFIFGIDPTDHRAKDRERRTWYTTYKQMLFLEGLTEDMIATYVQRGAVEQSVLANDQARGVGRLTILASILVPFSVVAGIFSMNGSFAAGKDLFYVFWVIVIPISAGLILWAFSARIKAVAIKEGITGLFRVCGRWLYRVLKTPFRLVAWLFGRLKRRYRNWRIPQSHASESSVYSLDSV